MNRFIAPVVLALLCCASPAYAQAGFPATQGSAISDEALFPLQDRRRDPPRARYVEGLWEGNIRIFLGGKALDEDDWEPVENQAEFAILSDFGPAGWPVHFAADLRFGASEEEDFLGFDLISTSWELNLGVRRVFETGTSVKPFIGGGISFGGAEIELDGDSESESGVGIWLDFGVDFGLGGPVSLGFEFCFSFIPVEIVGVDTDAGGGHFGITLGFGF